MFTTFRNLWRSLWTPPPIASTDALMGEAEREIDADVVETCGKLAMRTLLDLWSLDVIDPRHTDRSENADRCRAIILDIIQNGGGWRWVTEYTGDGSQGNEQWCGFTQAKAWAPWVSEATRRTWWASTYRLDAWASYRDLEISGKVYKNPKPASGPLRLYARLDEHSTSLPFTPQVGDILIVGDGKPAYGDHICGVLGYDPKRRVFSTVEGNGVGVGPKGNRRQGIVKAERPLGGSKGYIARRLIRVGPQDIAG
jgi:hypothetical protein